jgi:carbamoylphosphate synthase small subunit
MANEKKLTKREKYERLLAKAEVKADPIAVEFIEHELELLAKKNSSEKKPTAVQLANEGIKETILETLATEGKKMTISEMQKVNAELAELNNQKISALIRQLVSDGKLERVEEKRKAYFKIPD